MFWFVPGAKVQFLFEITKRNQTSSGIGKHSKPKRYLTNHILGSDWKLITPYFAVSPYFTLAFLTIVQSFRCSIAGLSPTNIFDASWSPLSCQSSHARATIANSPP